MNSHAGIFCSLVALATPFLAVAQETARPLKEECEKANKKAADDTLTPDDAGIWFDCNVTGQPWPNNGVPEGLNAEQPPPTLHQSPKGLFPTYDSEARS